MMRKVLQQVLLLVVVLLAAMPAVWAASPVVVGQVRFSHSPETLRMVFDVDKIPEYKVALNETTGSLVIELDGTAAAVLPQLPFPDPVVKQVAYSTVAPNKLRAVVSLKSAVRYKAFALKEPNRLVVDIIKVYEEKVRKDLAPGVVLTTLQRGRPDGAVSAYLLDIAPQSGYGLQPILSNDAVPGLETVKSMADRKKALAAVNASYFGLNGDIIGLLKIDQTIITTEDLPRTALGIMPEGKVHIGQPAYEGTAVLPDRSNVHIAGVNRERTEDTLVLYNRYYGKTTGTNAFGQEYTIQNGRVIAINARNSLIPADAVVLSAHGAAAKSMEQLKIGDAVILFQTLGPVWDQSLHAVGAGPLLVKNKGVFLSTKAEKFGSDVAGGRAPRTAVGITEDGRILLAVVDGRQYASIGFSLLELALFMQEAGAVEAMNLDGGGSSEMVVNGEIINKPSDKRERRVGSALAVVANPVNKLDN